MRRCFEVIGPLLLHIINSSIRSGIFPDKWKIACVVPIHKTGDRARASNYRPISLLPVMSNIAERVVCSQLSHYLNQNHLQSDCQFAYRSGHSTEDALLEAIAWSVDKIDNGHIASITTIDLSKAFDSIDHDVLLKKLAWYGIPSHWFESYLRGRGQIVRGGTQVLPVNFGVPQGSILGPILFSLVIADLPNCVPDSRIICYADDTQLLDSSPTDSENLLKFKTRLENAMTAAQTWFNANSLKMNSSKTDFILLGTQSSLNKIPDFKFDFCDRSFTASNGVKILGVTVDQTLSWDKHITELLRKCYSILCSLNKFRRHFSTEALVAIIQAHVFSQILYCLPVWGGACQNQLKRVQKMINFAARIVTGANRREHISPYLKSLKWPKIEEIIEERDSLKVHRALTNPDAPATLRNMFIQRSDIATRETRLTNSNRLHLPKVRLSATHDPSHTERLAPGIGFPLQQRV